MNPYDRRGVRSVWARVSPGRDVFAPGPWPGPPTAAPPPPPPIGQGGKPWPGTPGPVGPPTPVGPPIPPAPPPGQGGKPPQGAPVPPPEPPARLALDALAALAAGYDQLARRLRAPMLRRLAAQCRRNAAALRGCSGLRPGPPEPGRVSVRTQRDREQALREALERTAPACARIAGGIARDSEARSRLLSRLR